MCSIAISQPYLYPYSSRHRRHRYHDYHDYYSSICITCHCNNPTRYCTCHLPSSSASTSIYTTTYRDPCRSCRRYTCRCSHRYRHRTDDWYITIRSVYY
jgi:hypothetical protein